VDVGLACGVAWHDIGAPADFPEGSMREAFAGEPFVVVRVDGALRAFSALCPHKFGVMVEGELKGGLLTCPVHTATFDTATGLPLPGQEWAGRLPTYPVREAAGRVEVFLPE
jgi:nitrite reductase/ring-hydroxylating ferredoxin subunit